MILVCLFRKETVHCTIGAFTKSSLIQVLEIAHGNISQNLNIPFLFLFPADFITVSQIKSDFRIEFELGLRFHFSTSSFSTDNYPIFIYNWTTFIWIHVQLEQTSWHTLTMYPISINTKCMIEITKSVTPKLSLPSQL